MSREDDTTTISRMGRYTVGESRERLGVSKRPHFEIIQTMSREENKEISLTISREDAKISSKIPRKYPEKRKTWVEQWVEHFGELCETALTRVFIGVLGILSRTKSRIKT